MKKQSGILNLLLAAVVGVVMVVYMVCRTIQPAVVLPVLNIPMLLTLSTLLSTTQCRKVTEVQLSTLSLPLRLRSGLPCQTCELRCQTRGARGVIRA